MWAPFALLTDGAGSGTWSSSDNTIATVNVSGIVTGVSTGSVSVSYTVSGACGTASAIQAMTVTPGANAGVISGTTTLCTGTVSVLSETVLFGTWSSSNPSVATVSGGGGVNGVSAGTAMISYMVSGSCGSAYATTAVTVNPSAVAGTITGPSSVCIGSPVTLTDAATGGVWSSANPGVATISATGQVTGAGTGSTIISYTVTNSCGTATAAATISASPAPATGTISSVSSFCQGTTTGLSETVGGGTWSSGSPSIITVGSSGLMTGVSGGTAVISYMVTGSCGSAYATTSVTVSPLPSAGSILGPSGVCLGSAITLTDAVTGGVWSSSNPSTATVSTTGVVTGLAAGVANIYYTTTNGCGSTNVTVSMTVSAPPTVTAISGTSVLCQGTSVSLSETTTGGTWSSSNALVAAVSATGVVTGAAGGTAVISYSVTNSCTTSSATFPVTG